jgi:hypothetical protein
MPRKNTSRRNESRSIAVVRSASTALRRLRREMHPTYFALASVAVASALALGTVARFKTLGAAPLAVDEYFIVRSTQNVLLHGLPLFDCGGIYSRGLILQYATAVLSLLGINLDVAARFISAVSSVLALPAAFLLGRRVRGASLGLLVVVILALSVWEVEMARFARMYAPFQAVFLWYLVYFLRRTVDDDPRAERPMIALTVVGALLWEGGALLALANFLPVFLQRRSLALTRSEWIGLIKYVGLFAAVYWFLTSDFRMLSPTPALPLDYNPSLSDASSSVGESAPGQSLRAAIAVHRIWAAGFVLPLLASVSAGFALWRQRAHPLLAVTLLVALAAALAHQFIVAAAVLVTASLFRFCSWSQLLSPGSRKTYVAIALWAFFWLSLRWASWVPPGDLGAPKAVLEFLWPLVSFPDVINHLIVPWARSVPVLGSGLLLLLGTGLVGVLRHDEPGVSNARALHAVVFCLLLATCASDAPRQETRYVFFLYPAAIVLAMATLQTLSERALGNRAAAAVAAPTLCFAAFTLSDDFQPHHLLRIDLPASTFRLDLPQQSEHLVSRADTRALAEWLRVHAAGDGDVVINSYQSLDYYSSKVDFFYVDRADFNFESYACRYGTVDRWSNRPLLQSVQAFDSVVSSGHKTYLVTYSARLGSLLPQLARYHPTVVWTVEFLSVVALSASPAREVAALSQQPARPQCSI